MSNLEYLAYVQQTVDICLPLMEERAGIKLPPVTVLGNHKLMSVGLRSLFHVSDDSNFLARAMCDIFSFPITERNYVAEAAMRFTGIDLFCYSANHVFVNFNKYTNDVFLGEDEEARRTATNRLTIHELTHHIWFSIRKKYTIPEKFSGRYDFWSEGYAVYGEQEWFDHINPPHHEGLVMDTDMFDTKKYFQPFRAVKKLVEQEGKQILLELPNRWQEFDHIRKEITRT